MAGKFWLSASARVDDGVDFRGAPIAIELTPDRLGDVRVAVALISAVRWGPLSRRRRRL